MEKVITAQRNLDRATEQLESAQQRRASLNAQISGLGQGEPTPQHVLADLATVTEEMARLKRECEEVEKELMTEVERFASL